MPIDVKKIPLHRRQGFTLIELVAVILILSILAAIALPKFLDITDQAHDSAIKAVNGSFSTAVTSVRAQWLVEGGAGSNVSFSGENVPVSANGWPSPVAGTTDCTDLWGALMHNPPEVIPLAAPYVSGDGFWAFTLTNPTLSLCYYIYRPTYPDRLMWIVYYGHHATLPQWNGRIITSGF